MNDYKCKIKDNIIKFSIQARTNSFYTGQHQRLANHDENIGLCPYCGQINSLRHRLNDCKTVINTYKKRHDAVIKELCEMLKAKPGNKPIIHLDSTIKNVQNNNNSFEGENRRCKPDIWYCNNQGYTLIEVTIPYGDVDENDINSLNERYDQKKDKYTSLCKDIKEQSGLEVNYYVIVISSLGAWLNKSLNELRTLAGSKDLFKRFAKRITVATLRESQRLIYNNLDNNNGIIESQSEEEESESESIANTDQSLTSEGSGDEVQTDELNELYANLVILNSRDHSTSDGSHLENGNSEHTSSPDDE
ncbi:hypothetical protein GPJ56_001002 [Histomonas meleagridis]|nr:hypothetical protein GPJ56_001002 [Histomonas meleagridis]